MKRMNHGNLWVAAIATALALGCGSDEKPSTGSSTDDDDSSGSTAPRSETSSSDSASPTPQPAPDGLGAPVLSDVDPDTELSELDEDQLEEVCAAYIKTSDAVSDNLEQLCPAQSLFFAIQAETVTDDASFQAECATQQKACETQIDEANDETPEDRCAGASECGATLEDFNACNAQVAAMNRLVFIPLTKQEVSECSETSLADATNQASALGILFLLGLTQASNAAGGSPTDANGPCQRIASACPEFGLALGAFGELGSVLP